MTRAKKIISLMFVLAFLIMLVLNWVPAFALAGYDEATPNDQYYGKQWYLKRIKADRAWELQNQANEVVVAVLDSGLQVNHPDFIGNLWKNKKEAPNDNLDNDNNGYVDDYDGWDFVNKSPDPAPKFKPGYTEEAVAHGSLIAGILGAAGDNHSGIAGLAWKIKVMPLKVLDDKGETNSTIVVEAINYAINHGAKIINLSFAGIGYSNNLQLAIERAYNAGVLVVAAAGNDLSQGYGFSLDTKPMYPACHKALGKNLVIAVAATNALDQKAYFSSFGQCVDLAAPGISFFGPVPFDETKLLGNKVFNRYYDGYWSGTSFAVPLVSGTLALMMQAAPGLTPKELVDLLLFTADDLAIIDKTYGSQLGFGRLNAEQAVIAAKNLTAASRTELWLYQKNMADSLSNRYNLDGELINQTKLPPWQNNVSWTSIDINKDHAVEVIVGSKPGAKPEVKIFNQAGKLQANWLAYTPQFLGGVNVAAGDLDNNGQMEIITVPRSGGGSHVKIWSSAGKLLGQFFAFDKAIHGDFSVAVTYAYSSIPQPQPEILIAANPQISNYLKLFDASGRLRWRFAPYGAKYIGDFSITAVDTDANGQAEIITVPKDPKANLPSKILSNRGRLIKEFKLPANDWFITNINN